MKSCSRRVALLMRWEAGAKRRMQRMRAIVKRTGGKRATKRYEVLSVDKHGDNDGSDNGEGGDNDGDGAP